MRIPFTIEQFFEVFVKYNSAVWPMQIVFYFLAAIVITVLFVKNSFFLKGIAGILSIFWLWMGIVYHFVFFLSINPASKIFGLLFIMQGVVLALVTFRKIPESGLSKTSIQSILGFTLMFFALIVYPILTHLTGHSYPGMPTLGLPCPTTFFTIGVLLIAFPSGYQFLAIIPLLWSVVGSTAAFKLGVIADFGLIAAAICTVPLFLHKRNFGKVEA